LLRLSARHRRAILRAGSFSPAILGSRLLLRHFACHLLLAGKCERSYAGFATRTQLQPHETGAVDTAFPETDRPPLRATRQCSRYPGLLPLKGSRRLAGPSSSPL
jgi:hypothetical protein